MPDYIFMLESRLQPEQLRLLNRVQQEAQELSLNVYLVGGAVRDLMTGSPIRDLDFVAEGNPQRLVRRLVGGKTRRVDVDAKTRGAEIVLADGVCFSVEMARSESYLEPGRPPQVSPAPILEDLRRRDFSVNAVGISLAPGSRGLLLDPTNGLADVEGRELRVLHNYSFVHDPLRLLRLVRFSIRLSFKPEPRTRDLFESALERGYQQAIVPRALGREVEQIGREVNSVAVLKALESNELLAVIHPVLQKRRPHYDGVGRLQKYRRQAEEAGYRLDPFYPFLYYLLKRLKGRAQKQVLRRLGLTKDQAKRALGLEREARRLVKLLGRQRKAGPRQIYHLLTPEPVELLVFVLAEFSQKKKIQARVYNYLFRYRPLRDKLPVRELQLMGVAAGPKFNQILEDYFGALLDGRLRGRPQQLRYLRKLAGLPKVKPKLAAKVEARKKKTKDAEEQAVATAPAATAAAAPAAPAVAPPVRAAVAHPRKKPERRKRVSGRPTKKRPKKSKGHGRAKAASKRRRR